MRDWRRAACDEPDDRHQPVQHKARPDGPQIGGPVAGAGDQIHPLASTAADPERPPLASPSSAPGDDPFGMHLLGPPAAEATPEATAAAPPVQHQGGGESADMHATAEAGAAGAADRLPFFDQIQRSFGAHDVSGIRAHTDGAAADANAAMGSQAYARGNDVAFGGAPQLHTAAHEAAHVIQQRAGVHLQGGVGTPGDPYERHADAVADLVVSGGSAESLLSTMAGAAGGGSPASGAVQHQTVPASDTNPSPSPPSGQGAAAPTQTAVQRVWAATSTNNLPGLIAIQHDLRQQMLTDTLHPPADAREGLAIARQWTMDRVAAVRDSYAARIAAASTGATTGADGTGAVEALEVSMDADCTPFLDVLMHGDPQYRYLHPDAAVSEKVFAAVRLHSARRGVAQIGHRADAEDESRAHGRVATESWCGAFAFTQAEQGAGFDQHWVVHMQGEGGIRSALAYGGMAHVWLWAFDHWENLRAYHAGRGSERWYEAIRRAPPSRGIQPGDLVLIDNNFGTDPDHITTAISFDGRFLTTVGGNQGGSRRTDETGVSRSGHGIDLQANPEANDVRQTDAAGHRIPQTVDRDLGPKHTRVHGVGRWSIVDYERHIYSTSPQRPTAPPTSAQLAARG